MKIAYLSCQDILTNINAKPEYTLEHSQMVTALRSAFRDGDSVSDIAWDDKTIDWRGFDFAIIGTAWDYWDRPEEFIATLLAINSQTVLYNSPALVQWNFHKKYLCDLEQKGALVIPTLWHDDPDTLDWSRCFDHFDTDKIVVKRQIGANADGQFLLDRSMPDVTITKPVMIQPFVPSIKNEGEYSLIFIDGDFSHALLKTPAADDYRIQSSYGGKEKAVTLSKGDLEAGSRILSMLDQRPLYARVDMVRNENGELLVMELELIEPFLYPLQGPELGERIRHALYRKART